MNLEEEVARLMAGPLPVPVITEPAPDQAGPIPYVKQNRVPEALLPLEDAVAKATGLDVQQLILTHGAVAGERLGGFFEVRKDRAVEEVAGYLVAYIGGDKRLHLVPKRYRHEAEPRWFDVERSIGVIGRALAALAELEAETPTTDDLAEVLEDLP